MPVTIKDVAKAAGVTNGTVSRVFNDYPDVSPETRSRVLNAAKKLNYAPNSNARSLSSKRPPNLCFIAYELLTSDTRDANVFGYLKGILQYTTSHGMELEIYSTDSETQRARGFREFCDLHGVSAAVVCGLRNDDPFMHELMDCGIPVVGIDLELKGERAGWVSVDNRAAVREGLGAFLRRGIRWPLIVAGTRNTTVNEVRLTGMADAFTEAGLPHPEGSLLFADFSMEKAEALAGGYLDRHPETDGVFCFSDLMAMGVMKALRRRDLKIPGDVSVMGFDGVPFSEMTSPALATVEQDVTALGFEAAGLAHDLMLDRLDTPRHRLAPYHVRLRESVRQNRELLDAPGHP